MASDEATKAELAKKTEEELLAAQVAAENVLGWAPGEVRTQVEAALKLINAELDARADRDEHDDSMGYWRGSY